MMPTGPAVAVGEPVPAALGLLLAPGSVAELRAIGRDGRIASGYFDDFGKLAEKAEALDDTREFGGIYVTLNPVNPALLARRANRVETRLGRKDATTADADIVRRRWLPIDIDPVRPSGVSATAEERAAAVGTAEAVREFLNGEGWPAPIAADSGNGTHLLYRVDLPNDDESTALVRSVLAALDERFSTESAKVDCANYNAARIWKLYGTVSRKGDSTTDRPHRRSAIVSMPDRSEVVPADRLRALIAQSPTAPDRRFGDSAIAPARDPAFDLRRWLDEHGIGVASEKAWQGGTLYTLAQCPFSDAHKDGAYAVRFATGAVHAGCKHESCGGGRQRWQELRERFEPTPAERTAPSPVSERAPAAMSSEADPAVIAKAREVLERGDPVRFFLDCFARDHVGDGTLAHCLVMSIASQAVRNTKGLHVYVTGESGKGKSSGMTAMLKQMPGEFRLAERMSNKALYYSDDIHPGTVLMLDDITLSEELQEVLKEATSKFTEPVRMRTVDKDRRIRHCSIPERCTWWLANVSALYDDQLLNRMLICWVDDSEVQDREVFARRMDAVAAGNDGTGDRPDLAVCREIWRLLRRDGTVTVRIPFARRIRMASVRNRRNPEILVDLIRAHALLFRFQRGQIPLEDGEPVVVATGDDFRYAARLFADLHTVGGSLEAKFDRNEALLLDLAARQNVEQFTVADVQEWTGWQYQKAYRVLMGYFSRGVRHPGLLDRTPALSLVDQTVSEGDGEGRSVRKRALVFTFNLETYRNNRHEGQVWLDDGGSIDIFNIDNRVERGVDRPIGGVSSPGSANGARSGPLENGSSNTPRIRGREGEGDRETLALRSVDSVERQEIEMDESAPDGESKDNRPSDGLTAPSFNTRFSGANDERASARLHAFVPLDSPTFEPCSVCGRRLSHYRETRGDRRLCRRCHAAAVRREQRAGPPLPEVIDPGALRKVKAEIGRCDVCGLDPAAWSGGGVRLCDACYRRELRRRAARGPEMPGLA